MVRRLEVKAELPHLVRREFVNGAKPTKRAKPEKHEVKSEESL